MTIARRNFCPSSPSPKDEADGEIANDTPYGLAVYVSPAPSESAPSRPPDSAGNANLNGVPNDRTAHLRLQASGNGPMGNTHERSQ